MKVFYFLLISAIFCISNASAQFITEWAKTVGSPSIETATRICAGENGESYASGTYYTTLVLCDDTLTTVDQVQGNQTQNIFVSKFDSLGNCLWAKEAISIVPELNGGATAPMISEMHYYNGRIYCTGSFTDSLIYDNVLLFNPSCTSYCNTQFILVLDTDGSIIWSKIFVGSTSYSGISSLIPANDGIYIAGSYQDTLSVDNVTIHTQNDWNYSGYLMKLDYNGNCIWSQNVGSTAFGGIANLVVGEDENLYVVGDYLDTLVFPGITLHDVTPIYLRSTFFAKYDSDGNFIWARGGMTDIRGSIYNSRLAYHPLGMIFYTGSFSDSARFESTVFSAPSDFCKDILMSLDQDGNFTWVKVTGNRQLYSNFSSTIEANEGGFLLGSSLTDSFVLGTETIVSHGSSDALITQFNFNGDPLHHKQFGGINQEILNDVHCSPPYTYFAVRNMSNFMLDTIPVNIVGSADALYGRFLDKRNYVGLSENTNLNNASLFPNPSSENVFISANTVLDEIRITNCLGEMIYRCHPKFNETQVAISTPGIYFVQLISGEQSVTHKLVIE